MSSWQKNTTGQNLHFVMKSLASANLTTGVSVSGFVAKDGGALATVAGTITSIGGGAYVLSAAQGDTNFNSGLLLFAGVSMIPVEYQIFTLGYSPTGTNIPASVVNEVSVATSGIRFNAFVSTALTSIARETWSYSSRLLTADVTLGALGATVLTSIGGAVWTYPVSTANVSGSFGAKYQPLLRAEITSATSATVVVSTNATAIGDWFLTGNAYIVDGSGSGQPARLISDYESSGTTRRFTFLTEFAVVPNAGAFLEVIDGVGYVPTAVCITGEVSIATSGIRANSFQTAAFTSIAAGIWGYTGDKSVSVATSGIGNTALNAATYTSIGAANWAATTRLLTAGVTVVAMATEVCVATSGIDADSLTAAAIASIGAGIVASVAGEVSIAAGGIKSDSYASGILPTNFSSLLIDNSGRVDVGRMVGSSIAAAQMAQSGQQILNGTVGSGATSVSIPVSSLFPVSVWGTNSLIGRSLIFSISAATTALRGTPAAIVSSSPTVLVITTINAAPTTDDPFIIV